MVTGINGYHTEPLDSGDFCVSVSKNHTFGTDAVLLAHFASPSKRDRAVDLGTGCGIIPFLFLRDGLTAGCTGLDISEEAIALCRDTADRLALGERFRPICADLSDLSGILPAGCATLVTCNPPYTAEGRGRINPNSSAAMARHETACTLKQVVAATARLLNSAGRACFCLRPERLCELMVLMHTYRLEPKRLRFVAKDPTCEPWLFLAEGRKDGHTGLRVMPTLYTQNADSTMTDELKMIYGIYKTEAAE